MRTIILNKYTETYENKNCITHTLRHNFHSQSSIKFVQLELYTAESALFITTPSYLRPEPIMPA